MYKEYCSPENLVISPIVSHNGNGWYTSSLYRSRQHTGTPILVRLHHNWEILLSAMSDTERMRDALRETSNLPVEDNLLKYSELSDFTKGVIYRILQSCFADEEVIIHPDDHLWAEFDKADGHTIYEEFRKLDASAYGTTNWRYPWRFAYLAPPEERHLVISTFAYRLIHWDTVDPLELIKGAPELHQTARDTQFLQAIKGTPSTSAPTIPRCPTCSSTNITRITTGQKAVSVWAFGLLSQKVKHQFKCNNCGYEW